MLFAVAMERPRLKSLSMAAFLAALAALLATAAAGQASYRLPAYVPEELRAAGEATLNGSALQQQQQDQAALGSSTAASRRLSRPRRTGDVCRQFTPLFAGMKRSVEYWRRAGGLSEDAVARATAFCANSSSCIAFKV
jgi:hypothetical protein